MKRTTVFAIMLAALGIVGCNKSEKEINKEYSSGVVLIKNTGYYELKINDELSAYFTDYSDEEGLSNFTLDEDSIVAVTAFGTGFFVSEKGEIATNNHVVGVLLSEKQALKAKNKIVTALKSYCRSEYTDYKEAMEEITSALFVCILNDRYDNDYYALKQAEEKCEQCMNAYANVYEYLGNVNLGDVDFSYNNIISVAYNDEYITSSTDFVPCVLKATDKENDVAIIQLNTKKTPEDKHIFEVPEENPVETSSLFYPGKNDKLFMIGFNLGPVLALTKEGVKSQCTTGTISQDRTNSYLYLLLSGKTFGREINQG